MNNDRRSSIDVRRTSIFESVGVWESIRMWRSSTTVREEAATEEEKQQEKGELSPTEQLNNQTSNTPRNKLLSKVQHRKLDRSRVGIWSMLVVESIICLCSFLPYTDTDLSERRGVARWTVIVPSISIGVSCVGFLACSRQKTILYLLEGTLVS
jgi:hypothetical protein